MNDHLIININEVRNLEKIVSGMGKDKFIDFISGDYPQKLFELRKDNLRKLLEASMLCEVNFIHIDKRGEICGCEGKRINGWPAMWAIAEMLGLRNSCGNTDQYQIPIGMFNLDDYGAWNVIEKRKLGDNEVELFKFNSVIGRFR